MQQQSHTIHKLEAANVNGNTIVYSGKTIEKVSVKFFGTKNTLIVSGDIKSFPIAIEFVGDSGFCIIGNCGFKGNIRIGDKCKCVIHDKVTCTSSVYIDTAEGSEVIVGEDCMFAMYVELRASDGHPIYDVVSGKRVNEAKNIIIGKHVWIGIGTLILGGTTIGEGSVVGARSIIVKGNFPNNCIVAGHPAKVRRKNIAWERPHIALHPKNVQQINKGNNSAVGYWNLTNAEEEIAQFGQSHIVKDSQVPVKLGLIKRIIQIFTKRQGG